MSDAFHHYLGWPDANQLQERQQFLDTNFVETRAIQRALDQHYPFVSGRKGAGKSAVAYYLQKIREADGVVLYLREDHYKQFHDELLTALNSSPGFEACRASTLVNLFEKIWVYALHTCVIWASYSLLKRHYITNSAEAKDLRSFLNRYSENDQRPLMLVIGDVERLLQQAVKRSSPLLAFNNALGRSLDDPLLVKAKKAAESVLGDGRLTILIDTMERYDPSVPRRVTYQGMCTAMKAFHINGTYGERLMLKCFLPSEMTEYLFVANPAKFYDLTAPLEWKYSDLIEFVARRYATYLRRRRKPGTENHRNLGKELQARIDYLSSRKATGNSAWRDEAWRLFMPDVVRNRKGWLEDSAAYTFRHTQKRPRDLLGCMNHIVDVERRHHDGVLIAAPSILEGLHEKRNLHSVLTNSLAAFALPEDLDWQTDLSGFVRRLMSNERPVFAYKDLAKILKRGLSRYRGRRAKDMLRELERVLFRSGLVGACLGQVKRWNDREGQEAGYWVVEFEYLTPHLLELNEKSLCGMHPVLADSINTTEEGDSWVVYPVPESDDVSDVPFGIPS